MRTLNKIEADYLVEKGFLTCVLEGAYLSYSISEKDTLISRMMNKKIPKTKIEKLFKGEETYIKDLLYEYWMTNQYWKPVLKEMKEPEMKEPVLKKMKESKTRLLNKTEADFLFELGFIERSVDYSRRYCYYYPMGNCYLQPEMLEDSPPVFTKKQIKKMKKKNYTGRVSVNNWQYEYWMTNKFWKELENKDRLISEEGE